MAKGPFVPTRQQVIGVFNDSLLYEILFTFGVPVHDSSDYCNWEAINFNRMAHARLLYDFLEIPIAMRRKWGDVLAEDFGYKAAAIPLPHDDRERLNKDLMHLTYDRLRHTPATKPWPDSILAELHQPILGFMQHVETQSDLFPSENELRGWRGLISCLQSGKQMIISRKLHAGKLLSNELNLGRDLPTGKPSLTKIGQPL